MKQMTEEKRSSSPFANTPEPPYFAVIFSSRHSATTDGYGQMAERMSILAAEQPGYLGAESARGQNGFGITVSYWDSVEAITHWKANAEHVAAQELGISRWYENYEIRIARVERAYGKS